MGLMTLWAFFANSLLRRKGRLCEPFQQMTLKDLAMEQNLKYGARMIAENKLQRFENRTKERPYTVDFSCPEFTCLCPLSGFPDFAKIMISYQPDQWCVELKSLKLYINSFRDKGVYHEDVTNQILSDLKELLEPKYIKVVADFNVRGNIHTLVTAEEGRLQPSVGHA